MSTSVALPGGVQPGARGNALTREEHELLGFKYSPAFSTPGKPRYVIGEEGTRCSHCETKGKICVITALKWGVAHGSVAVVGCFAGGQHACSLSTLRSDHEWLPLGNGRLQQKLKPKVPAKGASSPSKDKKPNVGELPSSQPSPTAPETLTNDLMSTTEEAELEKVALAEQPPRKRQKILDGQGNNPATSSTAQPLPARSPANPAPAFAPVQPLRRLSQAQSPCGTAPAPPPPTPAQEPQPATISPAPRTMELAKQSVAGVIPVQTFAGVTPEANSSMSPSAVSNLLSATDSTSLQWLKLISKDIGRIYENQNKVIVDVAELKASHKTAGNDMAQLKANQHSIAADIAKIIEKQQSIAEQQQTMNSDACQLGQNQLQLGQNQLQLGENQHSMVDDMKMLVGNMDKMAHDISEASKSHQTITRSIAAIQTSQTELSSRIADMDRSKDEVARLKEEVAVAEVAMNSQRELLRIQRVILDQLQGKTGQ
ncbi:uncharacterized protein EHS24_004562 [Apiotrichum porosum]|uniref:Uncharacterized protein n=1 Tax=Apiotrichum porosum TaxID=105984 RepID=A0A427Y5F8_9TREE|nr:uncharacterized protein EHS24_004562 [Apiotrichum porosum]RSH86318.1 hypothetical protein EHS24_004562 [Apiotrichum porosum]